MPTIEYLIDPASYVAQIQRELVRRWPGTPLFIQPLLRRYDRVCKHLELCYDAGARQPLFIRRVLRFGRREQRWKLETYMRREMIPAVLYLQKAVAFAVLVHEAAEKEWSHGERSDE